MTKRTCAFTAILLAGSFFVALAAEVKDMIDDAENAVPKEQSVGSGARLVTREDKDNVMFEARDEKSKAVVHKSYVKKP